METPKEWPKSIAEAYDPLRVLGTGGFASVVLARHKNKQESTNSSSISSSNNINIPRRVAIKVVGGNSDGSGNDSAALLYARREIELLQQIRHCGIVKLFHSWERNKNDGEDDACESKQQLSSPTAGVLVLEYLKGPTVESLLKHGGALSTTFGRVVIAQVMDAIAYLHYRSVVHRDIKPDNIIVTGALSSDDSIWDNDANESVLGRDEKSPEDWKRLCSKYKATIIDFGFARALTPGDMEDTSAKESHAVKKDTGYNSIYEDDCAQQNKKKGGLSKLLHKNSRSELNDSHHSSCSVGSVSHKMKRVMSTLGNRNYAAPEIVNKVRQFSAQDKKKEKQKDKQNKNQRTSETTKTISEFVADYGLLVDSYSMGHTIRYMMTGVQPGFSVEEAIKKQQRSGMAKKVLSKFGLGKKKSTDPAKKAPRKPVYRSLDDLPGQVVLLIENLTMLSPHKRISIRKARRKVDWIRDVLSFQQTNPNTETEEMSLEFASEEQLHSLDQTRYLPLATTTPGSVVSTNSRNDMHPQDDADPAHTVKTSTGSLHEYPFDTSDSSNNSKDPIVEPMSDDVIGLCLEDDMITF